LQAFRGQDSRIEGVRDETQFSHAGDSVGWDTEDSHRSRTPSRDAIPAPTASPPRHLRPSFPHIQSSHGTFAMTSVGGDHNVVDSSRHVVNTNSGNTTTTVTTDSNNDSSVRVRGRTSVSPSSYSYLTFGSFSWTSKKGPLKGSSGPLLLLRIDPQTRTPYFIMHRILSAPCLQHD
jgi:hypothetical protein